jgi:ADP-heptose:LPS heptosyltransferase
LLWLVLTWLCYPVLAWRARRNRGEIRHVLVIQTAKIGDVVCATPTIASLKRAFPAARLSVLHQPLTRPLLVHDPAVDARIEIAPERWRGVAGKWRLLCLLSRERIDLALCLSPSLPIWLALLWAGIGRRWSVVPNFRGHTFDWATPLLTDTAPHRTGALLLDAIGELLERNGVKFFPSKRIHAAPTAEQAVDQLAVRLGIEPRSTDATPWIGIAVSSANKLKALPPPLLLTTIQQLTATTRGKVLLLGDRGDTPLAQELVRQSDSARVYDTTGELGLDELPALLGRLAVFVGVDTGIMYLADAVGTPVVTIVGPTDPREQRALGPNVRLIVKRPPCYPCAFVFRAPRHCATGTHECIVSVNAGEVVDAVRALIPA